MKRLAVFLLAFVLVLGMVPVTAQAAEVIASGKWCSGIIWTRYDDGTLAFSGTGAVEMYEEYNANMTGATRMVFEDGITAINRVDYADEVVSVEIADTAKSIGSSAFIACTKLTTVDIGDGVESIGERCFQDCENLKQVKLGAKLKTIGEMAFCYTGIESLTIPSGVTAIGDSAFAGTAL